MDFFLFLEVLKINVWRVIRTTTIGLIITFDYQRFLLQGRPRILARVLRKVNGFGNVRRRCASHQGPVHSFEKRVLFYLCGTPLVCNSLLGFLDKEASDEITGHETDLRGVGKSQWLANNVEKGGAVS